MTAEAMAFNIQEATEDWVLSISPNDIDSCLSQLELKKNGTMFARLDRLSGWILGIYDPQNFVDSAEPGDAVARRIAQRDGLLRRYLSEDDGNFVKTSNWDMHPLDVALKDEQILEALQRTTEAASRAHQNAHPNSPSGSDMEENEEDASRQRQRRSADISPNARNNTQSNRTRQVDNDERHPQAGGMIHLLAADGSEFAVPQEVGTLLAELIVKVRSLEELVLDQQRHAASSTHIAEGRGGQNVHFADTYTVHEDEHWMGLPPTPPPARRGSQTGLPGVNPVLVGGDRRSSARGPSWPNYSTPGNLSRSSMFHSRDIGQIVRKWQIRFSGAKSQSIDVFLARLEDCRVLANLSEEEVLSSLSELFTDTAATWYRNEKDKWATWQDFLTAARRWYGTTKRYQQRLLTEANNRTQGADEAVRDYITCLIAILRKMSPAPSQEQQLDQLHRNLRPQLQAMVRRTDFNSVEGLLELAVEAEQTLENAKTFRPPPLPSSTLLPEMAYKPSPLADTPKRPKPEAKENKVSAVTEKDPKYENLEEMIRRVLKQSLAQMSPPGTERTGKTTSAGPRGGRSYQPTGRNGTKKPPEPKTEKAQSAQSNSASPASTGANNAKEPRPPLSCYTCGLPGYIVRFCPNCSGNAKGGE